MSHSTNSNNSREVSPYLLRYKSALSGNEEVVLHRGPNTIGRSEDCDIVISDGTVSRLHARVTVSGARVIVYDLKSQNGTFIDDARISQGMLQVRQKLRLGLVVLQLVSTDTEFAGDDEDVETDRVDPEHAGRPPIPEQYLAVLSPRQREIVDLIIEGSPDKQIAVQVGISIHTVRHHLKEIYRVLGVNSRTMLLAKILGQHEKFVSEN